MIETLDSYFLQVQSQLAALGASANITVNGQSIAQPFGGIVFARDWPMTPVQEGALYLLLLEARPVGGTESQILYEFVCQWSWMLIGSDLSQDQQGQNRGDRYRSNMQVMWNLRQGHFPNYCQKKSTVFNAQTENITQVAVTSQVPPSTVESIWWTRLRFPLKIDRQSSIIYGVGAFSIFGYEDAATILY